MISFLLFIFLLFSQCIERAVSVTKKSSALPLNQCPICKSKTPKRSLNPSSAASRLCQIYEQIVRTYSEDLNDGNEDWIHEVDIKGRDSYYTGGGVPLDNLSQLYPYPEKPKASKSSNSELSLCTVREDNDSEDATQLIDMEPENYTEANTNQHFHEATADVVPSSPLIYGGEAETQLLFTDKLMINTQDLDKLSAINESIDRELAELDKKLEEKCQGLDDNKENLKVEPQPDKSSKVKVALQTKPKISSVKARVVTLTKNAEDKKPEVSIKVVRKRAKTIEDKPSSVDSLDQLIVKGISTTAVKDEKSIIELTTFSDKFGISIQSEDLQQTGCPLVIPTSSGLVVKKRTMKYFEALILGIEIISFDWIRESLKANRLLPRSSFMICGDEIGLNSKIKSTKTRKGMFSSLKFYFYGNFDQPPREQLEKLLISADAVILTEVTELTRSSIVLVDPSSQFTFETDARIIKKSPIVGPNWVMDSISCGRVLDFHGYLII